MRVFIRKELDTGKSINLQRLSPAFKIYAGLITKWHSSKYYRTASARRLEAGYILQSQKDDKLKEILLALIYKELAANTSLKPLTHVCNEMVIAVKAEYKDSLFRVLKHKDFLSYNIKLVAENKDLRQAFKDMPILIEVSKKVI